MVNDSYPQQIIRGKYQDVTYVVYDACGEPYRVGGGYLIVDGGYPKLAAFIDPMHQRLTRDAVLWSEWMETVRKDVECTFGILKVCA